MKDSVLINIVLNRHSRDRERIKKIIIIKKKNKENFPSSNAIKFQS
jgi:hypothetical protein